jgi:hypothetical protein
MAACERLLTDSEDRNCEFLIKLFQKQLQRLNQLLDQFIVRFLFSSVTTRNDAETLDLRFLSCPGRSSQGYRGNEAHNKEEERSRSLCQAFPRSFAFPSLKCFSLILSPPESPLTSLSLRLRFAQVFIDRFESQLVGTDGLEIRSVVDGSYERIANAMFDSLQSMARMDGGAEGLAPEDKGQLNYHVILIGVFLFLGLNAVVGGSCSLRTAVRLVVQRFRMI